MSREKNCLPVYLTIYKIVTANTSITRLLKNLVTFVVILSLFVGSAGCAKRKNFEQRVTEGVLWQMSNYPESQLVDVYKNFFHDKFGPGHMIPDSASAGAYIRRELQNVTGPSQVNRAEVTGWEGNFVRVDLVVLKENLVSYPVFMEAFMESAQGVVPPAVDEWRGEWRRIERIIRRLYPYIPDLERDSRFLDSLLSKGKYVVHHSETYTQHYDPHYRLFKKQVFETRLQPLLILSSPANI